MPTVVARELVLFPKSARWELTTIRHLMDCVQGVLIYTSPARTERQKMRLVSASRNSWVSLVTG